MRSIETLQPSLRAGLVVLFALLLAGSFVWYGTVDPDPADNSYPGSDEIGQNPDAYLGDHVSIDGTVVSHDPLQVETSYGLDSTTTLEITGVDDPPPIGHTLNLFGTLTEPTVIHAENTISRAPWEATYLYIVSFLGGLWVLGRLVQHWRVDRTTRSVIPRGNRDA